MLTDEQRSALTKVAEAFGWHRMPLEQLQLVKAGATNGTIAKADSATKGGVASEALAAAAGSAPSTVAIAAQIIECEIIGY